MATSVLARGSPTSRWILCRVAKDIPAAFASSLCLTPSIARAARICGDVIKFPSPAFAENSDDAYYIGDDMNCRGGWGQHFVRQGVAISRCVHLNKRVPPEAQTTLQLQFTSRPYDRKRVV